MDCWDFKRCGREQGGVKVVDLGMCPAYPSSGKDCWKAAGTFCGGAVQGTEAQKRHTCLTCEWYLAVNPMTGTQKELAQN